MAKPVCVVVGVGPGNGAAFARKFANEGFRVALLARNLDYLKMLDAAIPDSRAYACDVTAIGQAPQGLRAGQGRPRPGGGAHLQRRRRQVHADRHGDPG